MLGKASYRGALGCPSRLTKLLLPAKDSFTAWRMLEPPLPSVFSTTFASNWKHCLSWNLEKPWRLGLSLVFYVVNPPGQVALAYPSLPLSCEG